MAVKKSLSLNDKCNAIVNFFLENGNIFTFKQLEVKCFKLGVNPKSLKEILNFLVKENKVSTAKIGSLNCFWKFRSELLNQQQETLKKLELEICTKKKHLLDLKNNRFNGNAEAKKLSQNLSDINYSFLHKINRKLEIAILYLDSNIKLIQSMKTDGKTDFKTFLLKNKTEKTYKKIKSILND